MNQPVIRIGTELSRGIVVDITKTDVIIEKNGKRSAVPHKVIEDEDYQQVRGNR